MDKLDVNAKPLGRGSIHNEEQAIKWLEKLMLEMLAWRTKCDLIIPDQTAQTAQAQKRAMWTFLSKQGKLCGSLEALIKTGTISERCYKEMMQKATNTLIPTQVGVV